MNRVQRCAPVVSLWVFVLFSISITASAQFKVVGPPPLSPTAARQQVRTLLEKLDPRNRQQTIDNLLGLLAWYRDILDEELIASWKKDARTNLREVVESLADSRVASEVVEFSWREQRPTTFRLDYAPMFGHLMARFPESGQPLLDDLLGSKGHPPPDLSEPEAEAVCRILMDMPDIGMWRRNALQILPHYRHAVETLIDNDIHGNDQERSYQAQRWLADLRLDGPAIANQRQVPRRRPTPGPSLTDPAPPESQTAPVLVPSPDFDRASLPAPTHSAPAQLPPPPTPVAIASPVADRAPLPASPSAPSQSSLPTAPVPPARPYSGAMSGTLESNGPPIPQNAEYVFRNLPALKLLLDYDRKAWDARLVPGEGQTQRLILRNKSFGPQKRCVVHWTATQ